MLVPFEFFAVVRKDDVATISLAPTSRDAATTALGSLTFTSCHRCLDILAKDAGRALPVLGGDRVRKVTEDVLHLLLPIRHLVLVQPFQLRGRELIDKARHDVNNGINAWAQDFAGQSSEISVDGCSTNMRGSYFVGILVPTPTIFRRRGIT